ncbi:MAG: hypothetical protein RLZZ350_369 [Verrucomicrobiota bacterium]|jgi:restriction system protein
MSKSPRYVTCRCHKCDGGIEFDASGFSENETRLVICPHCAAQTVLSKATESQPSESSTVTKSQIIQNKPKQSFSRYERHAQRTLIREAKRKIDQEAEIARLKDEAREKLTETKKRQVAAAKAKRTKPKLFKGYVERHAKTLYFKRRALMTKDDYGKSNVRAWNEEVDYFINNVVPQNIRAKSVIEHKLAKKIVLDVIRQYALTTNKITELPKDPFEFERLCADILSKEGWKTTTTKKTGDQGIDVVAEKSGRSVILQCKLYLQPVGNKAVQEAFSGMKFIGASAAIVVSNAGFTKSAKQLAASLGVHLIHHSELSGLQSILR